jgi:hypothetical protein
LCAVMREQTQMRFLQQALERPRMEPDQKGSDRDGRSHM